MKTTIYQVREYLHDELQFFLYEPVELDIVSEEWNGKYAKKIKHRLPDMSEEWLVINGYNVYVKDFTSSNKHMLVSDYKPVIVTCISALPQCYLSELHERCEVLVEQRGLYVMVRCLNCGKESPLAINSLRIYNSDEVFNHKCIDHDQ